MKVSARNVFAGTVSAYRPGNINAEVEVDLGGGDHLVAVITVDSAESLGIAPGKSVVALVKAPWVMVLTDESGIRLSARNGLRGIVETVTPGTVNGEVVIALHGGAKVAAVITREAIADLGLKPGAPATAIIKASHVVLGVPT